MSVFVGVVDIGIGQVFRSSHFPRFLYRGRDLMCMKVDTITSLEKKRKEFISPPLATVYTIGSVH